MCTKHLLTSLVLSLALHGFAQTPSTGAPAAPSPKPQPSTASAGNKTAEDMKKELASLKGQLSAQAKQITELEDSLKSVWQQIFELDKLKRESAEFDPASPNAYERVETSVGSVLVSMGKAEPYLDGYSVELEVGNPMVATFKGFKLSATWGPRLKKGENYFDWFKKRKTKDFSFTEDLISGKWNATHVIIPDTKPEDFGFFEVSVSVNTVSLGTSRGR